MLIPDAVCVQKTMALWGRVSPKSRDFVGQFSPASLPPGLLQGNLNQVGSTLASKRRGVKAILTVSMAEVQGPISEVQGWGN